MEKVNLEVKIFLQTYNKEEQLLLMLENYHLQQVPGMLHWII